MEVDLEERPQTNRRYIDGENLKCHPLRLPQVEVVASLGALASRLDSLAVGLGGVETPRAGRLAALRKRHAEMRDGDASPRQTRHSAHSGEVAQAPREGAFPRRTRGKEAAQGQSACGSGPSGSSIGVDGRRLHEHYAHKFEAHEPLAEQHLRLALRGSAARCRRYDASEPWPCLEFQDFVASRRKFKLRKTPGRGAPPPPPGNSLRVGGGGARPFTSLRLVR